MDIIFHIEFKALVLTTGVHIVWLPRIIGMKIIPFKNRGIKLSEVKKSIIRIRKNTIMFTVFAVNENEKDRSVRYLVFVF